MEFETILLLLFLLLPLLSRLFSKNQPPPSAPPLPDDYEYESYGDGEPAQRSRRAQEEDPLADALRQIREALGEPAPVPPPPPEAARPLPTDPPPVRRPEPRPARQTSLPQRSIPTRSIPQRTVPRTSVPASATVPTRGSIPQQAVTQTRLESSAKRSKMTPSFDPGPPLEVEAIERGAYRASDLAARLQKEGAAREAVLLKEILDRPLGRRRGHR